jgi:hypothetical protein
MDTMNTMDTSNINLSLNKYPIQPKHIDVDGDFVEHVGTTDIIFIVLNMFKNKRKWENLKKEDCLKPFKNTKSILARLEEDFSTCVRVGFFKENPDKSFRVTHEFISKCFVDSPAKILFNEQIEQI